MELVRQTLIVAEKMRKNGDCISEEELGLQSPFPYTEDSDENIYFANHSMTILYLHK